MLARAGAALAMALAGAACSGRATASTAATTTSATTTSATTTSATTLPPPATGGGPAPSGATAAPTSSSCPTRDLPPGFTLDGAHSGSMDPSQYSQSGDMQAAMIYDGYQGGVREVYTDLGPAPGGNTDLVVECIVMQFQSEAGASQFIAAYKALRDQAGDLAQSQTPVGSVGAATLQYAESGQAFSGYNIAATNVAELSSQAGTRFYSVVVAGPSPSSQLALTLMKDLVVQP